MATRTLSESLSLCRSFLRSCLIRQNTCPVYCASVHTSPPLFGEPLKKKKRLDASVIMAREQKKRRRIEKQIRRLEKFSRKLKPIEEIEGERKVLKTLDQRQREVPQLSAEEVERRALLEKSWCRYRAWQNKQDMLRLNGAILAQERALDELKQLSPELYHAAIQMDDSLLPFESRMVVNTPPSPNYDPPDGDYIDTTKTYD